MRDNDAAPVVLVTSPTPPTAPLDTQVKQLVVSSAVSPPDIEDPEPMLCRNVDCYVSGLLASFRRETLILVVHEILILYPQSEYAREKERPILQQRCGGRPGQVGCTYITFEWKHIKEVLCSLGINAVPGCRDFVNQAFL